MTVDNETKNIVGVKIRSMRGERMMSQRKLVECFCDKGHAITPSTLSKIEKGKRGVTDIELKTLSEIFNCSIDELFKN